MIKIFIASLADYNEGRLTGKWIELPLPEKELELTIQSVLGDGEEEFITSYDASFHVYEHGDVRTLNDFSKKLESLSSCDQEKVAFLLERCGYSREKALKEIDDIEFYEGMTLREVAKELVGEGRFGEVAETIYPFIDFKLIVRELALDHYYETNKGTFHFC